MQSVVAQNSGSGFDQGLDTGTARVRVRGGKYLMFMLGREEYGLAILKVREIIGVMAIAVVPRMPGYVRGVINLRGQVIPVVDLRAKFEMEAVEQTENSCIIVVETMQEGRKLSMGILVDKVSEVVNVSEESVEDPPSFGSGVKTDFIVGMGKIGQSVKILLDIDRVLDAEEIAAVSGVAEKLKESAEAP